MVTSSAVVGSSAMISLGLQASADGDHHALAHAARELVRILLAAGAPDRRCRPASSSSTARARAVARPCRRCCSSVSVICRPMVSTGIERGHRLLEDHADVAAADLAHLLLGQLAQVAAVEEDLAGHDAPGGSGIRRMIDSASTDLPEPAFADDRHGLAAARRCRKCRRRRARRPHRCGIRYEVPVPPAMAACGLPGVAACGGASSSGVVWRSLFPRTRCPPLRRAQPLSGCENLTGSCQGRASRSVPRRAAAVASERDAGRPRRARVAEQDQRPACSCRSSHAARRRAAGPAACASVCTRQHDAADRAEALAAEIVGPGHRQQRHDAADAEPEQAGRKVGSVDRGHADQAEACRSSAARAAADMA